jgi:hypothetical protein
MSIRGNGLPRNAAKDALIETDLTRLLFEQLPASLVVTAANALVVAAAMSFVSSPLWNWIWFVAIVLILIARTSLETLSAGTRTPVHRPMDTPFCDGSGRNRSGLGHLGLSAPERCSDVSGLPRFRDLRE